MILGVTASQGGIWQKAMFKPISADDTLAGNTKKLGKRFGAAGELAGDLAIFAVMHRSNLTVPAGLTLISSQSITDATGIVQSLSVYYIKLGVDDIGRLFEFEQVLEKRMAVASTVHRPANITAPLTLEAWADDSLADAAAPWPAAPVTATKVGQLIVQIQGRVAAASTDMYLVPEGMLPLSYTKGSRVRMGARIYNNQPLQEGSFDVEGALYDSTSTLSASVVFSVAIPGAAQNLAWVSSGATGTPISSDITETGRVWRVRPDAEPTYWHKARGIPAKATGNGRLFWEVEILEGPAAGGSRVWAIGFARDSISTDSGVGFSADPGIAGRHQWFNDGCVRNDVDGTYPPPITPAWGVGDVIGLSIDLRSQTRNQVRGYINGKYVGDLPISNADGFNFFGPHVCKLGGNGALKFRTTVIDLPENTAIWN